MSSGLKKALERPDSSIMIKCIDTYAQQFSLECTELTTDHLDAWDEIHHSHDDDPDKIFDYVLLADWRSDNPELLRSIACGPLEDLLRNPSSNLLEKIIAEAKNSARFRWMLSHPFKHVIADAAWETIKIFRITGPADEPPLEALPPRSE